MWKHSDKASYQFNTILLFKLDEYWNIHKDYLPYLDCGSGALNHTYSSPASPGMQECTALAVVSAPPLGTAHSRILLKAGIYTPEQLFCSHNVCWLLDIFPWILVVIPIKYCVLLMLSLMFRMICTFAQTQYYT